MGGSGEEGEGWSLIWSCFEGVGRGEDGNGVVDGRGSADRAELFEEVGREERGGLKTAKMWKATPWGLFVVWNNSNKCEVKNELPYHAMFVFLLHHRRTVAFARQYMKGLLLFFDYFIIFINLMLKYELQ